MSALTALIWSFVLTTLLLAPVSRAYPVPQQRLQASGRNFPPEPAAPAAAAAYQQYEPLAVNVQPVGHRAIAGRQPYRSRSDDYFDDPSGSSSSLFVLAMLAIVIGVPCFLCYSRKNNVVPCCGDDVLTTVVDPQAGSGADRKSRRHKRSRKSRRHRRGGDRKSRRRGEKEEEEDSLSDENDSISLDDEELECSDSDSPAGGRKKDGHHNRGRRRRHRSHRSGSTDRRKKKRASKVRERQQRMLNSLTDEQPELSGGGSSGGGTGSAPTGTTQTMTTPGSSVSQQQQQQPPSTGAGTEEYAYIVYRPDTNYVAVSRSLKNLVPPNTTVVYKVDETSNMAEVGSLLKTIKSRIKASGGGGGRQPTAQPAAATTANTAQSPGTTSAHKSATSLYLPGSPNSGKTYRSIRSNYFIVNSDALLMKSNQEEQEKEAEEAENNEEVVVNAGAKTAEKMHPEKQQLRQMSIKSRASPPLKTNSTMFVYSTKTQLAKWSGLMAQPAQQTSVQATSSQPPQDSLVKPLESLPITSAAGGILKPSQQSVHFSAPLNPNSNLSLQQQQQQLSFEGDSDDFEGNEEEEDEEDDSSDEEADEKGRRKKKKMRARQSRRRRHALKHRKHRRQSVPERKVHRLKQRRAGRHRSLRV